MLCRCIDFRLRRLSPLRQQRRDFADKAAAEEDDLEVAKAQLALDSDLLADAQQDLARAGGDEPGRIQAELAAHEAEMKDYDAKAAGNGQVALVAAKRHGTLARRLKAWFDQRTRYDLVQQALGQAESGIVALTAEHNAFTNQIKLAATSAAGLDKSARLASLKRRRALSQILGICNDRIQSQQQLADVYRKWSSQLVLQHRIVLHLLLQSFALLSFSALFVIVDPVGIVPIFIALTPSDTEEHRRQMARTACFIAWALLVGFALGGALLFRALGVTLGAFKMAGGLLLLLTALDQLRAVPARTRTTAEEQDEGRVKEDDSVVPMAIPLLAGPGSIATSVMLMDRAGNWAQKATVLAAISFTMLAAWVALLASQQISRMLGTMGRLIVERLGGLVLAAFAVQFMIDGAGEALRR